MTGPQFVAFCEMLDRTFEGDLTEEREQAIREHFGRVPFVQASECIRRLVRDGQRFLPVPGELVATLRRQSRGEWEFECLLAGETSEQRRERLTLAHYGREPAMIERGADDGR